MGTSRRRYLTKSLFKRALECPTKLFYINKPDIYPDVSVDDEFLRALARGGHQVGALAQTYYPDGVEVKARDHDEALAQTSKLLERTDVVIFEAAVVSDRLFARIDILVKRGSNVRLIEVKAKSIGDEEQPFFDKRAYEKQRIRINHEYADYLYDVAFQTLILKRSRPEFQVSSYLMLADKCSAATIEGLNQKFLLRRTPDGRDVVVLVSGVKSSDLGARVLREVNVDEAVSAILEDRDEGRPTESRNGLPFTEEVNHLAALYCDDRKSPPMLGRHCKTCEFRTDAVSSSGFKECWSTAGLANASELNGPFVFDIWNFRKADKLIENRRFLVKDVAEEDIGIKPAKDGEGLSASQRQWMQVAFAKECRTEPYVDVRALTEVAGKWSFPLNFIDFETAMVAIPFNAGRRPYEMLAFQFSHHVVDSDCTVQHVGQYLHEAIGSFPNFDFLRALRASLERNKGTVFRYSHHENTVLCQIYDQLEFSNEPDREELRTWIRSVTERSSSKDDGWVGKRAFVDLCEVVKRFLYHPATGGSNSIKKVLPAILRDSAAIASRYGKPIYGAVDGIPSLNFKNWTWIKTEQGAIVDPYSLLPAVYDGVDSATLDRILCGDELADGGAAMTAYAMMQFVEMEDGEREALRIALLKYCELDTLAMVILYQYLMEFVSGQRRPVAA